MQQRSRRAYVWVTTQRLFCPQMAVTHPANDFKDRNIAVASCIYTQSSSGVLAAVRTTLGKKSMTDTSFIYLSRHFVYTPSQTLPSYNINLVCTALQLSCWSDIVKSSCATETNPAVFRCLGSLLLLGCCCMWQLLFFSSGPGPLSGTMKLLGAI